MNANTEVIDWLLDSDPAVRWQVMADLTDAPADAVADERSLVATEGWGPRLLALQADDGQWAGDVVSIDWTSTTYSLFLLRDMGLDPASDQARAALARVDDNVRWDYGGEPFFAGDVEPCVNGMALTIGSYFGEEVDSLAERLLEEQLGDGGWNCEAVNGSTRSSFHSTICILEGLLEYELATGGTAETRRARLDGDEFLLDRGLHRRLATGEVINPEWSLFSFPAGWRYDILRGLDYLRKAGAAPDPSVSEAVDVLESRGQAGRWPLDKPHPGELHFDMDDGVGLPSRWNTLRALRVLRWYHGR